jgi:hypothetical protein
VQVRNTADDSIVTTSAGALFDVPTVKGGVYVVERIAKPLSAYTEAHIGGDGNSGPKHLDGTMCTLGM